MSFGGYTNNKERENDRRFIQYMDLSGGLNTKEDAHAIDRNQLAYSVNAWTGNDKTISKRPGTVAVVTTSGNTGTGSSGVAIAAARFNGTSYLLSQQGVNLRFAKLSDSSWTSVSTTLTSGGVMNTAQMFDSTTGFNQLFIVDGKDTPQMWRGPGYTSLVTVTTTSGYLPTNATGSGPITPAYVITAGNNSNLVYAGEPTAPSAVYVSDPFFPQQFNFSATATGPYSGGGYVPYTIGLNDGVNGGNITGLAKLGSTIVVFKETAIYFMQLQSFLGEMAWTTTCVNASVGCIASGSITSFDTFICFQSVDGTYTIAADGTTKQISYAVPGLFDNTLTGFVASCISPTTAVGVRAAQRYFLFYDAGNPAVGYPTAGIWYNFAVLDKNGLPTTGLISGMSVADAVQLQNQGDDGNFVWTSATGDKIGKFGLGFSDYGSAITTEIYLKADMMTEEFGEDAPLRTKTLQNTWLYFAIPQTSNASLVFQLPVLTDYLNETVASTSPTVTVTFPASGLWGTGLWGTMIWSSASGMQTQYVVTRAQGLQTNTGRVLQLGVLESSKYPWQLLGLVAEVSSKPVAV